MASFSDLEFHLYPIVPLYALTCGCARGLWLIVYRHFVETGVAPARAELAQTVGAAELVDVLLRELHDRHMLVLDDRQAAG